MGRVVFQPHEVGFSRVQALRLRLQSIASSHTVVDSFSADLRSDMDLLELRKKLKISSVGGAPASTSSVKPHGLGLFEALTQKRPYDAVLGCVGDGDGDDDGALLALNAICLELSLPLLVVELSPSDAQVAVRNGAAGPHVLPRVHPPGGERARGLARHGRRRRHHRARVPRVAAARGAASQEVSWRSTRSSTLVCCLVLLVLHVEVRFSSVLYCVCRFLMEAGDVVPFYTLDAFAVELESFAFAPNPHCPQRCVPAASARGRQRVLTIA
ncbi:hypothetical protein PINS_up021523 [Pythium insidiosum]|nr:hypothetical protein PINS_up021523 [Pythium insidiosum]